MTKPLTFRQELERLIDKHWKQFIELSKQARKYREENNEKAEDKMLWRLREKVYDLDPVEAYILDLNPDIKEMWFSLKNSTVENVKKETP